jgi:UDP-N-acetylglucosamine--N-acetylmuramyl-(pentapeptide) pyrophosphoryl-undecaprenol N-acetylglucosamine transferase
MIANIAHARRVLIAAGGTGGHVFPALAVAQALHQQGWHAEWVGTDRGLESRVIPQAGFPLHILRFSGLRGKGLSAWLTLPTRLLRSLADALAIIRRARPQVVVAFGGYVTFPVGLAAKWRGIPLCVHEQNAVMGSANRWLAKIARLVMISFPGTTYAPTKAVLVGNPVRKEILSIADPATRYNDRQGPLRILVVGGSLGAQAINRLVPQAITESEIIFEIRHQTGEKDLESVRAEYATRKIEAKCNAFLNDMQQAYSWADLVICRAGASTVTEVAAAGVAAIFIPLPNAIDDHQTANAAFLSNAGAAWLMPQATVNAQSLGSVLATLNREGLLQRAIAARTKAMAAAVLTATQLITHAVNDAPGVTR